MGQHKSYLADVQNRGGGGQGHFWKMSERKQLFTELAHRPIQSISRDVRMSVCLSLCLCVRHTLETTLPEGLETSGRRAYR